MNIFLNRIYIFLFALGLILLSPACVDQEFDEPPVSGQDPDVTPTTTIAELKAMAVNGTLVEIEEDLIVDGIVAADDRSGNYFRSFIFQDETGGIEVLINLTDAYNFFPQGRRLFLKCRGLVLGVDAGVIQLGGYIYIENGGPQLGDITALDDHILRGALVGGPEPKVTTINALGPADINTVITLENVEFTGAEIGLPYSDPIGRQTINRTLQDCNGNTITVRTSGFADFAGEPIPSGNGSLTAVYSVFGATNQLFIRSLDDVQLDGVRCSGGGGNAEPITIGEVRDLFEGGASAAPDEKKITGIVISDGSSQNIVSQNMIIEDPTGGIVIRFTSNHNFVLGQEVEVVISGQELSEFNGLLQINDVSIELATSVSLNNDPEPRVVTVQEVFDNLEEWESTLVRINDVTISGGSTFSGGLTVTDATGSIDLFTRSIATFANEAVPAGEVDLMAIVSQFNDPQLALRNITDVIGGGGGGDPELVGLAEIRDLFEGGSGAAPAATKIRGIVISDNDNQNTTGRNAIIQDETGGIVVRFADEHDFALGEEVEVIISGQELSEFNGLFQVNNVPNTSASSFGPGDLPTPREATIQEVIDNLEEWESTLVKISNVTFTEGGTYSGSQNLNDGTADIATFTRSQATFADATVPADAVTLTAIVSQFDDPQLTLRNLNDIEN